MLRPGSLKQGARSCRHRAGLLGGACFFVGPATAQPQLVASLTLARRTLAWAGPPGYTCAWCRAPAAPGLWPTVVAAEARGSNVAPRQLWACGLSSCMQTCLLRSTARARVCDAAVVSVRCGPSAAGLALGTHVIILLCICWPPWHGQRQRPGVCVWVICYGV